MPKLLIEYEREIPTVSILRDQFELLSHRCGFSFRFAKLTEIKEKDIAECDIYLSIRSNSPYSQYLQKVVQNAGRFYIAIHDDDLANLPETERQLPVRKRAVLPVVKRANVLCSGNRNLLCEYAKHMGVARTVVLDTIVDISEMRLDYVTANDVVKIVFAAGRNHEEAFEKNIKPIVQELYDHYGKNLLWTFVGVHPDMSDVPDVPVEYVDSMPLAEYRKYMAGQHFSIGLAPLEDTPFNRNKYFNKYVEYTIVGVPAIYSNCQPYTFIVENEYNGMLCDNTPEAWKNTIVKMIDNDQLRKELVRGAQENVINTLATEGISNKLLLDIPELKEYHAPAGAKVPNLFFHRIWYYAMRVADIVHAICFYYKNGGIAVVFKKIKERWE